MSFNKQVLACLGYRGNEADDNVLNAIKHAQEELIKTCGNAKEVSGIWECKTDAQAVKFAGCEIKSKSFAMHMEGAVFVGIVAVTMGALADMLINRYTATNMSHSVIVDAVASIMINEYCGKACDNLATNIKLKNLKATRRFSPGYGDFSLNYQKEIITVLNADKRIGISLTEGFMLVPSKSITALVGFKENI